MSNRKIGAPYIDAKTLAEKFAAKLTAAASERDKQAVAAEDNKGKRSDDADHCKRAMSEIVMPFLGEVQRSFPKEQFSFAPQIDIKDHKAVGVSFRVGDGPVTTIFTALGNVMITRAGDSGSAKGRPMVYDPGSEPFISNSGDLTRDKIAKLIDMTIDHS